MKLNTSRFALALLVFVSLATNIFAQSQHATNARGFNANGAYASYDIDHINLFNGNLLITIPIGQTYPVNGNLNYSFKLVYNSFIWSYESTCSGTDSGGGFSESFGALLSLSRVTNCGWTFGGVGAPCGDRDFVEVFQDPLIDPAVFMVDGGHTRREDICQSNTTINMANNAGVGWQVHLGKLFRPRDDVREGGRVSTERLHEVYQSPDGSDHEFFGKLHETDSADNPNIYYTRDGSYLRMWRNPQLSVEGNYEACREEPGTCYTPEYSYIIDFPNGEKHYFQRIRVQNAFRLEGTNVIYGLPNYEDKLVRIEDQFSNYVQIDYYDDDTDDDDGDGNPSSTNQGELKDNKWLIRDSVGRSHTLKFLKSGSATLIDTIDLESVNGLRDEYDFSYALNQSTDVAKPHAVQGFGIPGYTFTSEQDATILLPFLTSVKLPDHSQYSMPFSTAYRPHASNNGAMAAGALVEIGLPTGGRIQWDYHRPTPPYLPNDYGYYFSQGISGRAQARVAPGIRKRRLYTGAAETSLIGTWSYDPKLGTLPDIPGCTYVNLHEPCGSYDIVNKVTQPTLDYTEYFFSVYPYPGRRLSPDPTHRQPTDEHIADYGLPFSKDPRNSGELAPISQDVLDPGFAPADKKLFISSIDYDSKGHIKRKDYVRYEGDVYSYSDGFSGADQYNPRLEATRTVYREEAQPDRYKEVQYSDFDGLGHYRKIRTSGNLSSSSNLDGTETVNNNRRTEFTNYNPGQGTYVADPTTNTQVGSYSSFPEPAGPAGPTGPQGPRWILSTYDKMITTEFGKRSAAYFHFDEKGQLVAKRVRKEIESESDPVMLLGSNDVLVNYDYDEKGNLTSETYFGGDRPNHFMLGTSLSNPTPVLTSGSEYRITYKYQCVGGTATTTSTVAEKFYEVALTEKFNLINNKVDCSTGLVTASTDSARLTTNYFYGPMSRLTDIQPAQGAFERIKYEPYTGGASARVTVWSLDRNNPSTTVSTSILGKKEYIYDGLGRLTNERLLQQNGTTMQEKITAYNEMDWVTSVTEWHAGSEFGDGIKTIFDGFDSYGRATTIRLPDRKVTRIKYLGDYQVTREVDIGTSINASGEIDYQTSKTTEVYDRQGRLIRLTEPSKSNGQDTSWNYTYNVNGQLVKAAAFEAAGAQDRTFSYDNLGNLLTQNLPERPSSQFLDHDTMGNVGKMSDGKNWLTYAYDVHGRIKEMRARDEATGNWPLLKSFTYYQRNDVDAIGNPSPGNRGLGKMATATRNNRITNPWEIENVAIGKSAQQQPNAISGGVAQRAVDGNTNGNYSANSVTHTDIGLEPWWQVDLGANRAVEQIRIWNRTDGGFGSRLTGFYVMVSDNPITPSGLAAARAQTGVSSYHVTEQAGVPTKINIGRTGRYVRVQLAGTNYLSLAEVEVMANTLTVYDVNVREEYVYTGVDGRLSKQVTQLNSASSGAHSFEQSFAYDQLGNLQMQDYPKCTSAPCANASNPGGSQSRPWTVHYNYTRGWLTSVGSTATTTNNNYASSIGYNTNGTINTIVHGNAVIDTAIKDPNNMQRPARIKSGKTDDTLVWDSGAGAIPSEVNYKYDGAGNITRIGRDWFLYDKVNRIVEGSVRSIEQKKRYTYDAFGNILTVTTLGGVTTPTNGVQIGSYVSGAQSATNRYTLNYDVGGNLVGVLGEGNQPAPPPAYTYDAVNMIRTVQAPGIQLTHLYGPDDERIWTIEKKVNNLISTTAPTQPPPTMAINDVAVSEGNSGTVNAVFTVSLSAASIDTVTVNYATTDGTAMAGSDYTGTNGALSFSPGQTSKTFTVPVSGDTTFEGSETFYVNLSAPLNAILADSQGLGSINNDDATQQPSLTISDPSLTEGSSGSTNALFMVSLSESSSSTVTVSYATANNNATAGSDYSAITNGSLTFTPGQTSKPISVVVWGDTTVESNETFFVNLSNAANATIADAQGVGTIINDDTAGLPALTINNISVTEGLAGSVSAVFTVSLSAASGNTVTVNCATANSTALAGEDYQSTLGQLTFTPGQLVKNFSVSVYSDANIEFDETFFVNLSQPANAAIADNQGQATIINDDTAPTPSPTPATTRFWSFDENGGEIAADTSGNGEHYGYFQNGTRWVAGMVNTGAAFDGLDDEVTTSGTDLTNNFTVSFWAMPSTTHQIDNESNSNIGGTTGQRYALWPHYYSDSGHAGAGISIGTNGVSVYEHGAGYMPGLLVYPTTINRWTHVTVVYENKRPKLYLNGMLVYTGLQSLKDVVHFNPSEIGGGSYGHYAGALDDLRVYNRALNATEVKTLVVPAGNPGTETVWVEDSLPAGANTAGSDESWSWIQSNPGPVSGASSHQSSINNNNPHQHIFSGASNTLSVGTGDMMFAWIYLDPVNPPREIMLQWNVNGSWEQRAYWGENLLTSWGTNMQNSRRPVGYLPLAGQWVRLEVPAKAVGLEGKTVNGMAFTLFGGRATWDRAGKYSRLIPIFEIESDPDKDSAGEKPEPEPGSEPPALEFTGSNLTAESTQASSATFKETITPRGLNNEVLREYQISNAQWTWTKDYIYAGSRLLASEAPGGTNAVRHYHLDHLGTPRVITNHQGISINPMPYQYFPFGDEATAAPPADEKLRFTGHQRDTNDPFQLDYMHARYYYRGGGAGKFMSVDPVLDVGRALSTPQLWNQYAYVLNNPIGRLDPDGRVDQNYEPLTFPNDPAAQRAFDARVLKGTVGLTLVAASLFIPGPEDVALLALGVRTALAVGRIGRPIGIAEAFRRGLRGEAAAGIKAPKVRIPSHSGTANYRVPDELTATTLREIKNVKKLGLTRQLSDFLHYAENGAVKRTFILEVRLETKLSNPLQKLVDEGRINLVRNPALKP